MATISDVARAAHVSIATVSRALNGSARVSEETAARVQAAAAALDYWPNSAAQSLIHQRARTLGVLLPDLHGEFFSEVIRGIDAAARHERFQILLSSSHASAEEVLSAARSMRGRVDGLIVMASDTGAAAAVERIRRRFPLVLLNPCFEAEDCATVTIANFAGAQAVARHLLDLGHRSIAIIKGPADNADATERVRGFRHVIDAADHGAISIHELDGDFTESSGYRAASSLLRRQPRPTAVFAANDSMAIGLMGCLHAGGISVPAEMAVVGFDDIAIARYLAPPLTTVRVDAYGLGHRAVELLFASGGVLGASPRRCETLAAELVIRRSCGAGGATEQSATVAPPGRSAATTRDQSRAGRSRTRASNRRSP